MLILNIIPSIEQMCILYIHLFLERYYFHEFLVILINYKYISHEENGDIPFVDLVWYAVFRKGKRRREGNKQQHDNDTKSITWYTEHKLKIYNCIRIQNAGANSSYLNMNMKRMRSEKKTATLSIVLNITNSWRRRFGMNRTNLRIRSSRKVRRTLRPELPSPSPRYVWHISITLSGTEK